MLCDRLYKGAFRLKDWKLACPRFQVFFEDNKKKIEGKTNGAKTDEDLRDLEFELEVAFLLLQDSRFEVVRYEGGDRTKHHPDYAVLFQKNIHFNVEVKRVRGVKVRQTKQHPTPIPYTQNEFKKFGDNMCQGCRQSVPHMINVLVITSDGDNIEDIDLKWAVQGITQMINKRDDAFFRGKGFNGAEDFLKYWWRLSGVVYLSSWVKFGDTPRRNELWCNPDAVMPIPESIQEYLQSVRKTRGVMP